MWVTFGECAAETPMDPSPAATDAAVEPPALLPSLDPPPFCDGDVRVNTDEGDLIVVMRANPTPAASPGVTSTSYWMNVRAAIQSAVRWPDGLRGSTSVVLRLQATPTGCVVLDPPPGERAPDAVRAAARRASERVARAPDEDIPPQAELAIHFEQTRPNRRQR